MSTEAKAATCVLIDRAEAGLVAFTSDDDTRYGICSLNITPERTEATNGHIAVTLKHNGYEPADFPVVPGDDSLPVSEAGVRVPREAIEAAIKRVPKKSTMPILTLIKVGAAPDGKGARLVTTDLENGSVTRTPERGAYPQIDKVIPARKDRPIVLSLNAKYLKALAAWAIANVRYGVPTVRVMVSQETDKRANEAARVEVHLPDGRGTLVGAIMPVKDDLKPIE